MCARFVTFAAAALVVASGAIAAEPTKAPEQHAKQTQTRSTPVVLASAEEAAPDTAPPPAKRRAARVTTCRCGGDPQPQQREEQQYALLSLGDPLPRADHRDFAIAHSG